MEKTATEKATEKMRLMTFLEKDSFSTTKERPSFQVKVPGRVVPRPPGFIRCQSELPDRGGELMNVTCPNR